MILSVKHLSHEPAFPTLIFWFLPSASCLSLPGKHFRPETVSGRGENPAGEERAVPPSAVPGLSRLHTGPSKLGAVSAGSGAPGLPVLAEPLTAHVIAGPHRGGAVVCLCECHSWRGFVVKFPPVPLGDGRQLGVVIMETTSPLGPKGHFWKWFGI